MHNDLKSYHGRYLHAQGMSQYQRRKQLLLALPSWPQSASVADLVRWGAGPSAQTVRKYLNHGKVWAVVARLGTTQRYCRLDSREDASAASQWAPPKKRELRKKNPDLARELQIANASIRAQFLKGTNPQESPSIPENTP
jgi:hypothetical protein